MQTVDFQVNYYTGSDDAGTDDTIRLTACYILTRYIPCQIIELWSLLRRHNLNLFWFFGWPTDILFSNKLYYGFLQIMYVTWLL